jgi:hypothetical protein
MQETFVLISKKSKINQKIDKAKVSCMVRSRSMNMAVTWCGEDKNKE